MVLTIVSICFGGGGFTSAFFGQKFPKSRNFDQQQQLSRQPGVDVMIKIFGDFCQFSAKKLAFSS
jgi:hypothetical protein